MIIICPSVTIAILYIDQLLTQVKCNLTAMPFTDEAAQWESILDASCSPDAAQRVPALFQYVSPLTLRVRLDRWPLNDPTSNEEQFWVEVNGPCSTDDLMWQLCYHLMQHPTDRAWEAYSCSSEWRSMEDPSAISKCFYFRVIE